MAPLSIASKSLISPIRLFPNRVQSSVMPENVHSGSNLIKKYADDSKLICPQEPLSNRHHAPHTIIDNSVANGNCSINKPLGMVNGGSLAENLEHAPRMKRNGPKKNHTHAVPSKQLKAAPYGPIRWMTTPQFRSSISTTCSGYGRMGTSCLDCIRKRRLRTSSMTKTEMAAFSKSFIFGIALGTHQATFIGLVGFFIKSVQKCKVPREV